MIPELDAINARAERVNGKCPFCESKRSSRFAYDMPNVLFVRCPDCDSRWPYLLEQAVTDASRLVATVESVLALHCEETGTYHSWIGPNEPKVMLEVSKDPSRSPSLYEKVTYQRCRECYRRGDCRGEYPCPTVAAVQSALEEPHV